MQEKMVEKKEVLDILKYVIIESSKTNSEVVITFEEWPDKPECALTAKVTIKIKKRRWFWRWL